MTKEEILALSRLENQHQDLAELDLSVQAGHLAGRVGALVCCLISAFFHAFTGTFLCSPWIIYFSMLGTHYAVRFQRTRQKTDLCLCVTFFAVQLLALLFFILRLMEVQE